jgi:hypothetical protein
VTPSEEYASKERGQHECGNLADEQIEGAKCRQDKADLGGIHPGERLAADGGRQRPWPVSDINSLGVPGYHLIRRLVVASNQEWVAFGTMSPSRLGSRLCCSAAQSSTALIS